MLVPMSENKKKSLLVKKGLSLSVLTLISRILGLLRERTKGHFLGTSAYSDAFGIAFLIPNLFRRLFAENSISVAFIPTFRGYLEDAGNDEGKKKTQDFVSATFTFVSFLTVAFVSVGIIVTPLILRIFYKRADADAMTEAVLLTRIMFPYLVVISVAAFFQGILNGLKIFAPSGFTPILFNGIVIALTYILAPHMANPARAMAVGVVTGGTVQALFQLPFVLKNNWKVTFTSLRTAFSNPGTRQVLRLIGPTIIGMAAYQLNDVVSSALATRAGQGIYSSISYSLRLQELILGICAVTVGTVTLPDLTGFAKKNLWDDFSGMLIQSIKIMALISIPITFYSLVMGENIISLLFSTGKFDASSVGMTLNVFHWHIVGLFFIAVNRVVAPAFYAQSDTKSPTWAGLVNFAVNITMAVALVKPMGGPGIALALTVASFVNMVMLFVFMRRNKSIDVAKIVRTTILYSLKMLAFSLIASVPVYFLRKPLVNFFAGHSTIISHGLPVVLSALLFAVLGIIELVLSRDSMLKSVMGKFSKRR